MQRYEHKSTWPENGSDPYTPQLEGWELCGVTEAHTQQGGQVYGGPRTFYWKRPVGNLERDE